MRQSHHQEKPRFHLPYTSSCWTITEHPDVYYVSLIACLSIVYMKCFHAWLTPNTWFGCLCLLSFFLCSPPKWMSFCLCDVLVVLKDPVSPSVSLNALSVSSMHTLRPLKCFKRGGYGNCSFSVEGGCVMDINARGEIWKRTSSHKFIHVLTLKEALCPMNSVPQVCDWMWTAC